MTRLHIGVLYQFEDPGPEPVLIQLQTSWDWFQPRVQDRPQVTFYQQDGVQALS